MKLLLDENLPHALRTAIVGHEVSTVAFMGWSGVENGRLLVEAAAAGFDALVTNDRGIEYEQDLDKLPLAVLVLLAPANTLESLKPLLPHLQAALDRLQPREFIRVTAG